MNVPAPFGAVRHVRPAAVAGLLLAAAAAAEAQSVEQPQRPTRALFGTSRAEARPSARSLELSSLVFGGYDDARGTDDVAGAHSARRSGGYVGVDVDTTFTARGRRNLFTLLGNTEARYDPALTSATAVSARTASALSLALGRSVTFTSRQTAEYMPSFLYSIGGDRFGVAEAGAELDLGTAGDVDLTMADRSRWKDRTFRYGTAVDLAAALGRSTVRLAYDWSRSESGATASDMTTGGGLVTLSRPVTRYGSLRLGYGHHVTEFSAASAPFRSTGIDAGLDYSRPISSTRKTSLTFGSTSSILNQDGRSRFRLGGNIGLMRQIGRSWTARADYTRHAEPREGFAAPFLLDRLTTTVGGFFGRRVNLLMSGGLESGTVGFGSHRYDRLAAATTTQIAVSHNVALVASHRYQRSHFDAALTLPERLPRRSESQSVRIGLSLWFPF